MVDSAMKNMMASKELDEVVGKHFSGVKDGFKCLMFTAANLLGRHMKSDSDDARKWMEGHVMTTAKAMVVTINKALDLKLFNVGGAQEAQK